MGNTVGIKSKQNETTTEILSFNTVGNRLTVEIRTTEVNRPNHSTLA